MKSSRRWFLRASAALSGAVVAACRGKAPEAPPSLLGRPISAYGERSPHEKAARLVSTQTTYLEAASSRTPLGDSDGMITPSSLHFERHHAGVPQTILLRETGVRPEGRWFVAEGADACKMTRSVPIEKAWDDALVAYAQNGEALRPEQGYPIRLLLPGWEGNASVKWLRQIKVVDQPMMSRDETSKYTDLLPDGRARQFTFLMEAKSVITRPSAGQRLNGPGFYEISGLAWSGGGTVTRVEVSTDGGATWTDATLQLPVLPKAHTRFT